MNHNFSAYVTKSLPALAGSFLCITLHSFFLNLFFLAHLFNALYIYFNLENIQCYFYICILIYTNDIML